MRVPVHSPALHNQRSCTWNKGYVITSSASQAGRVVLYARKKEKREKQIIFILSETPHITYSAVGYFKIHFLVFKFENSEFITRPQMKPPVKISCNLLCRITLGFSCNSAVAFLLTVIFSVGCYFDDFCKFLIYRSYEP